jgi:hypothetical protein
VKTAPKSKSATARRTPTKRRLPRAVSAKAAPVFSADAAAFISAAVADGLAIQHRFKAEPVYARTGVGYMAPTGVAEIAAAKHRAKPRVSK